MAGSQPGSRHPLPLHSAPGSSRVWERLRGGGGGMRLWFGTGERSGRSPVWAWALGRESIEWGGSRIRARPPFRFSPLLSGVQPGGWQLLQEMHPDSRRHVQRWALLSPLQGEKDQTSTGGRAGPGAKKRLDALDKRREGGGAEYCGRGLSQSKRQWCRGWVGVRAGE